MTAKELKLELQQGNIGGLALDIDDTLAATDKHWWDYMFAAFTPEDMSREEITAKYKFAEEVPAFQTAEAAAHIKAGLHSGDFNEAVPLIEGADKAVQELHNIIPIVAYITARPHTVIEATKRWLTKHGFPEAPIIVRPEEIELSGLNKAKNRWKSQVLEELYPQVLGIVDDNATLAEELEALGYKGKVFLYGPGNHDVKIKDHIVICPTWHDVVTMARKLMP